MSYSQIRSMNGLNDIDVNEITFEDGTTLNTTGNIADVDKNNVFTALNTFNQFPFKSGSGTDLNPSNNGDMATKFYVDNIDTERITAFTHDATTGTIELTQALTGTPIDTITMTGATITTAERNAITANTAKVGITQAQADAITANTAKVGITQAQADAITANTNSKINSVDFNTTDGVLTITKEDTNTITKDLDGRYFVGTSLTEGNIPDLNASKITTGTLAVDRIPDLNYVETTGDETISGVKTFSSVPKCSTQPSSNDELANKQYVDNIDTERITAFTHDATTGTIELTQAPTGTPIDTITMTGATITTAERTDIGELKRIIYNDSNDCIRIQGTTITSSINEFKINTYAGLGRLYFRFGNPNSTGTGSILGNEDNTNYFYIDWRNNSAWVRFIGAGSLTYSTLSNYIRAIFGEVRAVDVRCSGYAYANDFILNSDDRIKHNEEGIPNALELIDQLKPLKYDKTGEMYDADYTGDISGVSHKEIGFIAQDIQKIPYLAFAVCEQEEEDHDGKELPLGLNYNTFIGLNTQGIKDLHTKVKSLEERVQLLEDFITKNIL